MIAFTVSSWFLRHDFIYQSLLLLIDDSKEFVHANVFHLKQLLPVLLDEMAICIDCFSKYFFMLRDQRLLLGLVLFWISMC